MIKRFTQICALAIVALFFVESSLFAQSFLKTKEEGARGSVSYAQFDNEKALHEQANAKQLLLGLQNVRATDHDFKMLKSEKDELGFTHEKYQQYYKGIRVEYGEYNVHAKGGLIESVNGDFHVIDGLNTKPTLTESASLTNALQYVGAKSYKWEVEADEKAPKGELVVCQNYLKNDGSYSLAYKFNVYAHEPVSRAYIFVDAHTGVIIHKDLIIKHVAATGSGATRYSGTQTIKTDYTGTTYRLREATRGLGIETYNMKKGTVYTSAVDFTDTDNNWSDGNYTSTSTTKDNSALDAHWGAATTYDYWFSKHSRNSYDNAGAKILSYVHYSSAYDNAYWDGTRMTYGDGSGTGGFNVLTSLDVCAHEIGHAVCEKTANLVYSNESGAMNEGFSDIWGACIEAFGKNANTPNTNTWLIGEDIEMRSGHLSLRSMSNPKAEGQPDTYKGTNWYAGTADNGGVHTNSGVLNHWFYILTMGKTGTNDKGSSYSVTGIGIDKAAKIAFRLESVYLTSNSTYANATTYGIQAAVDLYGAGSAEAIATQNAWYAVGLGSAYVAPCSVGTTPTSLVASSVTATGATLGWASTGANSYNVQYRVVGTTTWTSTTSTTNSKAITGLTANTNYEFQVQSVCTTNSAFSASATFTTPLVTITYCASKGTTSTYEWIDLVKLGTINRVSSNDGGYSNQTALSTNLTKGTANTISFSAGFSGTAYTEYWRVYIDWNQDGDFADAGETVVSTSSKLSSTLSGSFTVPTTALSGATRMRVSMKYNAAQTSSCETFSYGEVEDYTVNVVSAAIAAREESTFGTAFGVYPNPVKDQLNIRAEGFENGTIRITNMLGEEVYNSRMENNTANVNVSKLTNGFYLIQLKNGDNVRVHKFVKE
jgi:bacillolysin